MIMLKAGMCFRALEINLAGHDDLAVELPMVKICTQYHVV